MTKRRIKIDFYNIIRVFTAILLALIIAAVIIFIFAEDPEKAFYKFLLGPFTTKRNFFNVVETTIPLVFCGLAINVMHKSGLFSMIADSSFYMSGVVAALIAILCPLPAGIHQIVILSAAVIVGGCIGIIPAFIRKWTGANELVISLMLNYIFYNFGYWLIRITVLDKSNDSFSVSFLKTATLGKMFSGTSTHYGIIIMVVTILVIWFVIEKTKFGRELKITGANSNFAKIAGIRVGSVIIISQLIGGAVAGLGGGVEMIGMYTKFQWVTAQSYVWDGILVNLLAGMKPNRIIWSALFLSYIRVGANVMSRSGNMDATIVSVIQATIILLIASERFMYQLKKRREEKEALAVQEAAFEEKGSNTI